MVRTVGRSLSQPQPRRLLCSKEPTSRTQPLAPSAPEDVGKAGEGVPLSGQAFRAPDLSPRRSTLRRRPRGPPHEGSFASRALHSFTAPQTKRKMPHMLQRESARFETHQWVVTSCYHLTGSVSTSVWLGLQQS